MDDQASQLRNIVNNKLSLEGFLDDDEIQKVSNSKARIITITSGKGGVGKTNTAVNLGIALHNRGKKVVILDADLGFANVNIVLGVIPKYNLHSIFSDDKDIKDVLTQTKYGVSIIAGASGVLKLSTLSNVERLKLLKSLTGLSDVDIIIIDTSAGVSNSILNFVEASDDTIIVTTSEPTAMTDAYGIIKVISKEVGDLQNNIKLIVNRAISKEGAELTSDRIVNIASEYLKYNIDYIGYILEDPLVSKSVIAQIPYFFNHPKCPASICIDNLALNILNEKNHDNISVPAEERGMLKFLSKIFKVGS